MGIAVLGPLLVDGGNIGLGPRDRVVLAALAVARGQVLSAEQLADALWGDGPPASWNKIVQGCVVRLRKSLGRQVIRTSPQGYFLDVPADDIDAQLFERLVGRARELLTLDQPGRAAHLLGEALGLWRGRALAEVESWPRALSEAGRLDELRRDAEELRVEAVLRTGRYHDVLATARTLVEEAPVRERRWALLALAQYQAGRQGEALRTLHQVRAVLATELGLDPGPDLATLEQAILRQDPSLVAAAALPEPSPVCPYRGLSPYEVDDGEVFFGRDADVAACMQRLTSVGVLAVLGPSGSGKSSLVRAGVTPTRERDGRRVVVITPGAHPMDALSAIPASGPRPLLVVDQCEEVFTLCADEQDRARFLSALVTHAERGELVVALRADRLGEVPRHAGFSRLVERGLYLLGAMSAENLRATIEGPARQAGLSLEPGLVDLLVREVEGEPGALPLLSHALRETWQRREAGTLTVAGYRDTGGIRGAVAQSAEQVYEQVSPEQRPALRALLLRLVTPAGEGEPTRSRLPRRLVAADAEHERLIELLVGARLVTSDDGVVELAHEALVRAWPRLRGWLDDDTAGQRMLHHLSVAADAWDALGRPASELYRGVRLAQTLDWRERAGPDLTPTERAYLDASRAGADADLRAAQDRAEHEAAARRRTRRLAGGLAGALVLTLITTGLAVRYQQNAAARASDAAHASTLADANRLAALSTTVGSLDLSLLLAAEAAQIADTPETQDGLLTALVEHRRATRVVPLPGQAYELALGDDGRRLFADIGQRIVSWRVGSTSEPTPVVDWYFPMNIDAAPYSDEVAVLGLVDGEPQLGVFTADGEWQLVVQGDALGGWPWEVAFTPDGRGLLLVVANQTRDGRWAGSVREIDLDTGRARTIHRAVQRSSGREVWIDATFADDGSSVAVWSAETDGQATLLDLDGGSRTTLRLDHRAAGQLDVVPLPTGAAQLWADGAVTLHDLRGRPTQVLDAHQASVQDILLAPDGTWGATTGADGEVLVWDVDAATGLWSRRESLVGHDGAVTGAELTPDGRTLFTGSQDHSAVTWDLSADAGFGSVVPGLGHRWISNRPERIGVDGLLAAPTRPVSRSGDGDSSPARDTVGVAATFLHPTGRVVDQVRVGDTLPGALFGSSVSVSPDGRMVAVTSGFATTVLDTRTREVLGRVVLPPVRGNDAGDYPHELVWAAGWTRGGARLVLAAEGNIYDGQDGGLVVVNPATWTPERRVRLGGSAQVLEQSPDGRLLAVGEAETQNASLTPRLWILDAENLRTLRTVRLGAGDFPFDLSFSPDGQRVAVGGALGLLSVIDPTSGRLTHEPVKVHDQFVQQVEWMPDGRTVVTSGADGQVSRYDAGRDLVRGAPLPASNHLSPDSQAQQAYTYLMPGAADEIVALGGERPGHRYPMRPTQWVAAACAVVGRDLTRDEWSRYVPGRAYHETCGEAS